MCGGAVSLGATAGWNRYEQGLRFYGEGMPNPSAAAAQFALFPGEGGGTRYGPSDDEEYGFHGGVPQSARNFARDDDLFTSQTAGAPVFGLTFAMRVATACCRCRCDAGHTAAYTAMPDPGQSRPEACAAYCATEACGGADFAPGVCVAGARPPFPPAESRSPW